MFMIYFKIKIKSKVLIYLSVGAHVLAVVELEVELWAVLDAQVAYRHVVAQEEPDKLQQEADRSS
jgi:hypothetical protein